ncbi:nucleotidase [Bacillus carboniphilus]|uniref:Nucleotidase n=1 Tax=Bacillus carboniphilus TaxID=86663 RepID=A0ABN0WME9_9BACI
MKNQLRFGIDIDGTVTNPNSLLPHINKAFGSNLKLEDVTQYDLSKVMKVSPEEFHKWFVVAEHDIYSTSPLAQGAKEVLSQWKEQFELYFISARGSEHLEATKKWFDSNELFFHHIELIGTHDKIGAAKKYDVDIFLEDKHDNAVNIHLECGIPVLLFDTPYNREPIPNGVIRVTSWEEANTWVQQWIQEKQRA